MKNNLEHIVEKRALINSILSRKINRIGHILRRSCLFHYAIEGKITVAKRKNKKKNVGSRYERQKRMLGEKEETEDRKKWKQHFIS